MNETLIKLLSNFVLEMLRGKNLPFEKVVTVLVAVAPTLVGVVADLADGDPELSEDNRLTLQKAIEEALDGEYL